MTYYSALKSEPGRKLIGDGPFGYPHDLCGNRFVYTVISPRARGLSIGVNMNPDKLCNFDCAYCETNRQDLSLTKIVVDVDVMVRELEETLERVQKGRIAERPFYRDLPAELLKLRHVALSGDGEPTLSPNFDEIVEGVVHVRARGRFGFFKVVLITNGSALARENISKGLNYLASSDEIWVKVDAGTQEYMDRVNRSDQSLDNILANILFVGRQRPVIVQSLFPEINGEGPSDAEIEAYCQRLKDLTESGARIPLVQVYSATRPTPHSECGHLPLRKLSKIARRVREVSGLRADVF